MLFSGALRRCDLVWVLPLVTCSLVGCSSQGEPSSLSGQVTFDGKPVEDGDLRLDPIAGTPGQGAPAWVHGGKYEIPVDASLLAGKYRVWVTATRRTGRTSRPAEPMPGEPAQFPEVIQYIPAKYNERSELTVTLAPGENTHDFTLESGD